MQEPKWPHIAWLTNPNTHIVRSRVREKNSEDASVASKFEDANTVTNGKSKERLFHTFEILSDRVTPEKCEIWLCVVGNHSEKKMAKNNFSN